MASAKTVTRLPKPIKGSASDDESVVSYWHEAFSEEGYIPNEGTRAHQRMLKIRRKIAVLCSEN